MILLGAVTSVFLHHSIQDAVAAIAEAGYEGVDVWGGRPHVYRNDLSPDELSALRGMILDRGLSVTSFMPAFYRYPHSLSHPNRRVREDSVDYMRQCIDHAVVLGAQTVLVVPDHSLHGQTRAESLQRMADSLDAVARYASQSDVKLGVEASDAEETDLVNSSEEALALIQELGYDCLGVVMDTGALNVTGESSEAAIRTLGRRLLQWHVNDNHGARQENLVPGDGTFDFRGWFRLLREQGYEGMVSVELSKGYALDPVTPLRISAQRLRAWMSGEQGKAGSMRA